MVAEMKDADGEAAPPAEGEEGEEAPPADAPPAEEAKENMDVD